MFKQKDAELLQYTPLCNMEFGLNWLETGDLVAFSLVFSKNRFLLFYLIWFSRKISPNSGKNMYGKKSEPFNDKGKNQYSPWTMMSTTPA
ncbi:MAG: hypothetical protein KGZ39_01190 [Simkania sp.]|nr:hypothetical protein [Simkania sp.]